MKQWDMAKEAVHKAIKEADIRWENVNTTKLVRHVSLTVDRKRLKDLKLDEVVPRPKRTTTLEMK